MEVRVSQRILYHAEAPTIIVLLKQADQTAFKLIALLLFPPFHVSNCTPAIPPGNDDRKIAISLIGLIGLIAETVRQRLHLYYRSLRNQAGL
jgi:hypothetical protein